MTAPAGAQRHYNRLLLLVAGLGGLLYGVDVGIIGGALPYLQATSSLSQGEISIVVAAVLLGSVFSTLFAGLLADWMGRKPLMLLCGVLFVLSIPVIALSSSFSALFVGRLLQGMSGGFIGVVVPLYLAECLPAQERGRGTGIFQWLLTLGIVCAAVIGIFYSYRVAEVARTASATAVYAVKNGAWRNIFWMSMPPGILFAAGCFFVAESPRWLFRRGRQEQALTALLRSRSAAQAALEMEEMARMASVQQPRAGGTASAAKEPLLRRRYVIPFLLACVILACNTATGINSVIGYNTDILLKSGLSDIQAHWAYVVFTTVNFLMTVIGMTLVDRRGRKFLFVLGTSGIIVSLLCVGGLFLQSEAQREDVRGAVQAMVHGDQVSGLHFDAAAVQQWSGHAMEAGAGARSLSVIYSYGGFTSSTSTLRSDDASAPPLTIRRADCVPDNTVEAFFSNPLVDLASARTAPLHIDHAYLAPIPSEQHGWLVALGLYAFVAFYALGPGVCVWLALSELMPTRIRSNGMSIALVLNQLVSTTLAAIFLPVVGSFGYSTMFFVFVGFTVVYLATVVFFLPETKGKTLEEIEAHFEAA